MSPAGHLNLGSSPRASPRNIYSLAWSPHPPTSDSVRRSARITPTRSLFVNNTMDFDTTTPLAFGANTKRKTVRLLHPSQHPPAPAHCTPLCAVSESGCAHMLIVSVASVQQPNSRKVLKMGGATNVTKADFDFEDYVLTPLSPFTPYENTERETARGGQAKLKFTTVSPSPLRRLPTNEAFNMHPTRTAHARWLTSISLLWVL
jgi:hypothetical protein